MVQFYEPSDKAKQLAWFQLHQHLFEECPVDKSFMIRDCSVKLNTMRSYVSRYGKAHGNRFKVVQHDDCFEICRKK